MKESVGIFLASGLLTFGGCHSQTPVTWEYESVTGKNDTVLQAPAAEGWVAIGVSVAPDGQKTFLLRRQKGVTIAGKWQYKTVVGHNDNILTNSANEGWEVVGISDLSDGNKSFLLKKPKT
ncbi:MAG TPA: hypothetical protein VMH87_00220 [Pseudomonadales bacterium]|nr:hypothetical protein [Pseudomonadales bacterium]